MLGAPRQYVSVFKRDLNDSKHELARRTEFTKQTTADANRRDQRRPGFDSAGLLDL